VPEEEPHTSDWRRTALFTAEDVESAVILAGEAVYGSDERLDHLVRETRRFLEQRQRPSYGEADPDHLKLNAGNLEDTVRLLVVAVGELQHRLTAIDGRKPRWPGNTYEPDLPPEVSGEA
jgi:hypothetical protein